MVNVTKLPASDITGKNTPIWLNIFWVGFLFYIGSYVISITGQVSHVVCNLFQILGLLMFVPTASILSQSKISNMYLRVVFFLFCCWSIGVIFRGIKLDYDYIKYFLFNPSAGFLVYLIPFILLIPINTLFLKKTFDTLMIFSIFYIIYDIMFLNVLLAPYKGYANSMIVIESFSNHLSLPSGFLLLTYIYHSKKRNFFALFIIFLTFLLATIRARRGLMFMSFTMMIVTYLLYQYANKTKIINIILSLFLISTISFIAVNIYVKNRNDTFGYITQKIAADTRSGVETYFYKGMTTKDWIIGKGINGKYYCPMWDEITGIPSIYRDVIETGYLQVILNGGIVSLGLFSLIAIPAILKGFFSSRNILSKAAALWIFLFLIFSYPGTPTSFSLFYILVWISIGICYSNEYRSMSDDSIKELLSDNKPIKT